MTLSTEEQGEQRADRTSGDWPGVGRRPLLKAIGAGAALSATSGVATADDDDDVVDQPEGFEAEVVAPHATFADDVGAALGVVYEDGSEDSVFLQDASTVVIAKVSLEPGGTSGWHADQGPVIASVVEGELAVSYEVEDGCVTRTYAAGDAAIVTGSGADEVANASDTEGATAYVMFLGVPDGEPPSEPVEPPDC